MVLERDASVSRLHLVNTVLAARRYYLDGASKSEIAIELGISRFKVARLLDKARRDGIVRIDIDPLPELDLDLGDELARRPPPRSWATSSRRATSSASAGGGRSTPSSASCRVSPHARSSSSWAAFQPSSSR